MKQTQFLFFLKVWGTSKDGQTQIPIAWVSGMTDRQANLDGATSTLVMTLDQKWISLAKAYPPFFLKQTRVQDRDIQTLLDEVDMIAIKLDNQVPPEVYSMSVPEITREMRQGKMPEKLRNLKNSTDVNHKLLLIHGKKKKYQLFMTFFFLLDRILFGWTTFFFRRFYQFRSF